MGSSIRPLQKELIYHIAAGEVIDSLSAAVRELVDNALDAGATRIQISLWPQQGRVQVSDNGSGMAWSDLQQAARPHTTSKIATFENFRSLSTLGFRGEALHSLAQLGQLEICSRQQDKTGWRVLYSRQGEVAQGEEIALANGTTVAISGLFQTWPSRQDVPKPQQAVQSIQGMIGDYALCHPHVTWQVSHAQRDWFSLAPGSPKDLVVQLLRKSPDDLHYSKTQIEPAPDLALGSASAPEDRDFRSSDSCFPIGSLELVAGLPDRLHRQRPDWIKVAVNGRRVSVNVDAAPESWGLGPLEQAILTAFRQTVPRHRYPVCWLHLQVPPDWVDWNRTASKSHIYLHHLDYWRERVTQQIRQSLHLADQFAQPAFLSPALLRSAEQSGRYTLAPISLSASFPASSDSPSEVSPESSDEETETELRPGPEQGTLRAIAQLHQTYILAEHPTGLWLIEQHIAHERVLYEQICHDWQLVDVAPIILRNLTPQQIQNLQQIGFEPESFGPALWAVRTVPEILALRPDCSDALYELSRCRDLQPALVAAACRSALRNGQTLSLIEMQTLIDQWQRTQQPRTCPHGRPIYLALEEQALSRFFRRHWVIGKSHGL